MARTRYFDYKMDDATLFLNEWLRGVLQEGVYYGFNAVPGSSGLSVSIEMSSDPTKAGEKLGKVITPSGLIIEETEDLVDVATGFTGDVTSNRIDYLVATYVYNASLPNNDVTYQVVQGTAGSPPTPPTLNSNQLLLAEIWMPPGASTILSSYIQNVTKKELYAETTDDIKSLLRNGVYRGLVIKEGTAVNKISLTAGFLVTPQELTVSEAAEQADLFTLTDTASADYYRYDVLVCLKKGDDNPDPHEFLIVEGSEADESAGAVATIPDDSDILAAATAYDAKYTSSDYVTKIGYIRVQGITTAMVAEYSHYPKVLMDYAWYVSAGKFNSSEQSLPPMTQVWPHTGHEGLVSAMSALRTLMSEVDASIKEDFARDTSIKVYLDGDFHFPPKTVVGVPSGVILEGLSATSFRFPADDAMPISVILGGFTVPSPQTDANKMDIRGSLDGVSQTGVPAGYERVEIEVKGTADRGIYSGLPNGLVDVNFAGSSETGDPIIYVYDGKDGLQEYSGWFEQYTTSVLTDNDWTFTAILVDDTAGSGGSDWANDLVQLAMYKGGNGLRNTTISLTRTVSDLSKGALVLSATSGALIDEVVAPSVEDSVYTRNLNCKSLSVESHGYFTEELPNETYETWGSGNSFSRLDITPERDLTSVIAGYGSSYGAINFDGEAGVANGALQLSLKDSSIVTLSAKSLSDDLVVGTDNISISNISLNRDSDTTPVDCIIEGIGSWYGSVKLYGGSLIWSTDAAENVVNHLTANVTAVDNSITQSNVIAYDELISVPSQFISSSLSNFFEPSAVDYENSVILTNDSLVSLSYTATTGWVAYGAPVDLSSVRAGDTFLDAAGLRTRIEEVDDAGNRARVAKDIIVSTTVTGIYDGAIIRGNSVFDNTGLVSYTYNETTGVVQYALAVDLSHVKQGYLFVDSNGEEFHILSANDGLNQVTLETNLTVGQAVSIASNGSIVTNNNPRNLLLNDCQSGLGILDIPYSKFTHSRGKFEKGLKAAKPYKEWIDERIAFTGIPTQRTSYARNSVSNLEVGLDLNVGSRIEVTGFMTGAAFGLGEGIGTSPPFRVYVDGALVNSSTQELIPRSDTGKIYNRSVGRVWSSDSIRRLSPGVHTIGIELDGTDIASFTHVFLFNQPSEDESYIKDGVGRLWLNAARADNVEDELIQIPAIGPRGGRIVRYAPEVAPSTRDFVSSSLATFEATGLANSPTDNVILNVTDLGELEAGDLILIEEAGTTYELHCIQSVTAPSTITLVSNLNSSFNSSAAVNIKYRGKTILNPDFSKIHAGIDEVDNAYSVGDFVDMNIGNSVTPSATNTTYGDFGANALDGVAFVGGENIRIYQANVSGYDDSAFQVNELTIGAYLTFGFVGSGLDLLIRDCAGFGNIDIYIDGCLVTAHQIIAGSEYWLTIASDLNYCMHTVKVVVTASTPTFKVAGFRTYQPILQSYNGEEIIDTNVICDYLLPYEYDTIPAIEYNPEGVIDYSPELLAHFSTNFTLTTGLAGNLRRGEKNLACSSSLDHVYLWFFGDALSLLMRSSGAGGSSSIEILNNQDSFVAPSTANKGFTVTGPDSLSWTSPGIQRFSWTFSSVGLHCIRLDGLDFSTTGAELISYGVHQPYYKGTRYNRETLLRGFPRILSSYEDRRKVDPVNRGKAVIATQFYFASIQSLVGVNSFVELPFTLNSKGGLYVLRIDADTYITAAGTPQEVVLSSNLTNNFDRVQIGAADNNKSFKLSAESLVNLPRGLIPGVLKLLRSDLSVPVYLGPISVSLREAGLFDERIYSSINEAPLSFGEL